MTKREAESRAKFAAILWHNLPVNVAECTPQAECAHLADLLCRHGVTYSRLQEMHCNGVGTWYGESAASFAKRQERFEKQLERREILIEKRIRAICESLGYVASFEGDPRGHTVRVVIPGLKDSGYQDGVSVPTS
jgi:hypothetical protein